MSFLLVIGGATAVGKTELAIRLAGHFDTAILSADSRQFYREMSIGTAKPGPGELAAAPHYFVDSLHVGDPFSVGDFERQALEVLGKIFTEKKVAVLVGGAGLFLQAVCEGLDDFPTIPEDIRELVATGEQTGGLAWLQAEVSRLDPAYFATVDTQNPARLRRALQVCLASDLPYSAFLAHAKTPRAFTPIYILLERPRPELYARIDNRVDGMIAAGLEEEARRLLPWRAQTALQTVGYQEFFDFFDGKISRGEAIDKIKQHTRNFAKRQATWFRKHGDWTAFHPDNWREILAFAETRIR